MSEGPVGDAKVRPLERYWTKGEGLARWAMSPHPYTMLVRQLQSENVPEKYVHGLAAKYYHAVFHIWPGDHSGGKNRTKTN